MGLKERPLPENSTEPVSNEDPTCFKRGVTKAIGTGQIYTLKYHFCVIVH